MKNFFYHSLCAFAIGCSSLLEGNLPSFQAEVALKHTEGKGLGYKIGYTSLDLFLAQPLCCNELAPFTDLRGHAFNNGRFAGNAGLGLRWMNIPCKQVWGINFFYDAYAPRRRPYHQLSIGLEVLGEAFEVHLNGYLPVGKKKTNIYLISYGLFRNGFLCKVREQLAMGGIDLELGYRFCKMKGFDFYAGLGPYYYCGRTEKTKNAFTRAIKEIAGGRLRVSTSFMKYWKLEGTTTYDNRFKWGGQAVISFNFPFRWTGCFENVGESCAYYGKLYQPVVRNEIILINQINRFSSNPEILNPEFEP